jgi:hypothetical protein
MASTVNADTGWAPCPRRIQTERPGRLGSRRHRWVGDRRRTHQQRHKSNTGRGAAVGRDGLAPRVTTCPTAVGASATSSSRPHSWETDIPVAGRTVTTEPPLSILSCRRTALFLAGRSATPSGCGQDVAYRDANQVTNRNLSVRLRASCHKPGLIDQALADLRAGAGVLTA